MNYKQWKCIPYEQKIAGVAMYISDKVDFKIETLPEMKDNL